MDQDVFDVDIGRPKQEHRTRHDRREPEPPAEPDRQDAQKGRAQGCEAKLDLEGTAGLPADHPSDLIGNDDVRNGHERSTETPLNAEDVEEADSHDAPRLLTQHEVPVVHDQDHTDLAAAFRGVDVDHRNGVAVARGEDEVRVLVDGQVTFVCASRL